MTVQPLWWRVASVLVLCVWALAAVVIFTRVLANDADGASYVPVEIGEPKVEVAP